MDINYLSICSGIEAATVAWHPLGWTPKAFAEIEKFPSAVLANHYPDVPNVGDFTQIKGDEYGSIDLLVGGTPCQDFSVAGLRAGMAGQRGQLTIEFARLAERVRPRWLVWENVPGVLSIEGGRAFGTFLAALGKFGYGVAYRVLDAQYFGVPQRRRRVFVIGYLGDWRPAAAVLFERESLLRNPAPSRKTREEVASTTGGSIADGVSGTLGDGINRQDLDRSGAYLPWPVKTTPRRDSHYGGLGGESETLTVWPEVSMPCMAQDYKGPHNFQDGGLQCAVVVPEPLSFNHQENRNLTASTVSDPLRKNQTEAVLAFDTTQITSKTNRSNPQYGDPCHTFARGMDAPTVVIGLDSELNAVENGSGPLKAISSSGGGVPAMVNQRMSVRRLTPVECERLQGFPDNYTKIHEKTADGPRYKALGNSMAVPVMRWIGERIELVENMIKNSSS